MGFIRGYGMKVMITGGLGFVGSNLAEGLLDDGHDIIIVARSKAKLSNISSFEDKVTMEYLDVTDLEKLAEAVTRHAPDAIFHFAGQLTSYESFDDPLYDVDVNSKSTLAMLEAIRKMEKPCRFILGSTFWVVGNAGDKPVDENSPCEPLNIYAANRLASEHYCKIYHKVYDLDTVIMRLTNTFGIKEQYDNKKKAALNFLIYKGFRGEDITIYDKGEFFRDYMYVSDVVSAAKAVMEKGQAGECYFIGTGKKTWFYEIAQWLDELTPGKIVWIESPDYHKRINVGSIVVDNTKLKGLGWDWKVSAKEGIEKVLEYYETLEN